MSARRQGEGWGLARVMLSAMMRDMYVGLHPLPGVAKSQRRFLHVSGAPAVEVCLAGLPRQGHRTAPPSAAIPRAAGCRLCWPQESIVYHDRLAIAPDQGPFFPFHMLVRPVRPPRAGTLPAVRDGLRRGLVTTDHLDCRPHFTETDIAALGHLVLDAPDYRVTQSMDGSGASIPEHTHAHAFPKSHTSFPLLASDCFKPLKDVPHVWATRQLTYAILIRGTPEVIAAAFSSMRDACALPSNHCLHVDDAFGGLVGVYVPRVAALPLAGPFAAVGWRLGAFEVLGLFDAATEAVFHTLSGAEATAAIASVTLRDERIRRRVEASCARAVHATSLQQRRK